MENELGSFKTKLLTMNDFYTFSFFVNDIVLNIRLLTAISTFLFFNFVS